MGCGCGGSKPRRQVRNILRQTEGVLSAAAGVNEPVKNEAVDKAADDRKKIEKLRRDAILRALGRP